MGEVMSVAAPPAVPAAGPTPWSTRLIPLVTLVMTAAMVAAMFAVGSPLTSNPMFLMFPAVLAVSALAGLAHGGGRQAAAELDAARRRYLSYLHEVAQALEESAAAQRQNSQDLHPDPSDLWLLADTPRRGERTRGHEEFCRIRVGRADVVAATRPVAAGDAGAGEVDPVTTEALHRLLAAHSTVADVPVTVDLRATPLLHLGGAEADARARARAMLCQLATFHSPAEVAIVAVTGKEQRRHWEWLKWLPHHAHPGLVDDLGPVRLMFRSADDALAAAGEDGRVTVVVVDGVDTGRLAGAGLVSSICIAGPSAASDPMPASVDSMSLPAATTCARRLAAHSAVAPTVRDDWLHLAAAADLGPLQVPLGITERGEPLHLDIKEAALGGAGPHGLCLGATGSGKSELLRAVALGMIARHSPQDLNLILIDFKGGATFLDLERAPHVSAVITNLADEAYLVDRLQDALGGEIHRRQQLLRAAGNLPGLGAYAQARKVRPDLAPLPTLFLVVDEFSELLARHPDFIEQFVAVGRLGRSLGIHLLLASQRLDEGRLRGLDSHLSYRICLKTLSANESRAAIGVVDAHHLPAAPGAAYFKVGAGEPVRFQTAHVSGPAPQQDRAPVSLSRPRVYTCAPSGRVRAAHGPAGHRSDRRVLDVVLDAAAGRGPAAHRVWLPPLVDAPALSALLTDTAVDGALSVPIGLSDRAFEQQFAPVVLDLSGAAGNVAVVGAPQTGKSTAIRTLALALSARHHPGQVQLYCLDFGGGALAALAGLPHVGAVADRQRPELVHRTVAHVAAVLRGREADFSRGGIGSMAEYRRRIGEFDDEYGDVFLVVDGWATVRQEFDGLEQDIASIAAEGLSFGVHVVLTSSRWADIRPALKDQLGTRIELRLGDPVDSDLDRNRARVVPANRPGSGLAPDGFPMMVAVPTLDATSAAEPTAQVEAAATTIAARHQGRRAPAVRLLPGHVDYDDLAPTSAPLLGVNETSSIALDFDENPHVLISGDIGCGKTSVLRLLCREISRTTASEAAHLYVVDPRRTLLADLDPERVAGYAGTATRGAELMADLALLLRARVPGADVPAHQLRSRSWWTGATVYVIVDDYDLLGSFSPLSPLADLLAHAPDIGLRTVVAQRENPRSLYDPVTGALRDLGAATVQFSSADDPSRQRRPGRAVLSTRSDAAAVQVAWVAPT
jgi:S-DNA-T family DNA segregation ATPase FtsK/SpoIIIE